LPKKRKILIVLPTLGAGGAQRILTFLAKNITNQDFNTHLLIIGKPSNLAYNIEGMAVTFLNQTRVLTGIPNIVFFMIKYRPNIVLSSIGHLNTVFGLLAPFFASCKFIIRESSVISFARKYKKSNTFYGVLSKIAYKNIDAVVCQSQDMADDFIKLFNMNEEKITIINNPITEKFPLKKDISFANEKKYITVGRLSREKGHIRLLDMLAKVKIPFHYTIIGSGPEKEIIDSHIKELGLSEKITQIPFTNEIGKELSVHDVFLQGSYVEGFPNAVLESCVVGTPVIAFNVPGGTKEIIKHKINGCLVNSEDEFIVSLDFVDQFDSKIVRNSVIDKFDQNKILNEYIKLFLSFA
jgi:glycosyltransferase involved in cell wall biosynthesis